MAILSRGLCLMTCGLLTMALFGVAYNSSAASSPAVPAVGDLAPVFKTKTHEGKTFDLASRKGKWTVLYFYPKADTPGCTAQACAFRDSIKKLKDLDADVFGVSADGVSEVAKFHKKHQLNFTLLADPELNIIRSYGVGMEGASIARRWTFIIDPELRIRSLNQKVDPAADVNETARMIKSLQELN